MRVMFLSIFLLTLSLSLPFTGRAWSDGDFLETSFPVKIQRSNQIPTLTLDEDQTYLYLDRKNKRIVLKISGSLLSQDQSLVLAEKTLISSESLVKSFTIRTFTKGSVTRFHFSSIDAYGKILKETVLVKIENYDRVIAAFDLMRSRKLHASVAMGIGYFSLRQTAKSTYNRAAPILKAQGTYEIIPGKWDLAANAFFNGPSVIKSMTGVQVYVFGANLRTGYVLPFFEDPWKYALHYGIYFSLMSVSSNSFGYDYFALPQFYPVLSRRFANQNSISFYLKYVSATEGIGVSFTEREIAGGIGYVRKLRDKTILYLLDISDFSFKPTAKTTIGTRSISFSLGYGI